MLQTLRARAEALERDMHALALAYRDPRTPWYARAWALLVVAYALSPIDLIPDFIPVLGYLDDLILVPIGFWVALRLIPRQVREDRRQRAADGEETGLARWLGIALVGTAWLMVGLGVGLAVWRCFR